MLKEFSIFKNDKKQNEKEPDYRLTTKKEDIWLDMGAGWSRTSAKGKKFISCKLGNAYKDIRKGYHLDEDKEGSDDVNFD